MLRFYGSSGRDSVGRSQHSSNRVSGISTRTMLHSTTPSLSQTIWPRWASRQFLTLPIVQTLLSVTFDYLGTEDAEDLREVCPKIRKKDDVMTAGRWSCWPFQIPQFFTLWWPAMKAGSTAMTKRPRDQVPSESMMALPDPRRPDRANPPTNFWWSLFIDSTDMIYMHWVRKGPALFKSGHWYF